MKERVIREAESVVEDLFITEMMHAVGCGCFRCRQRGKSVLDWYLQPSIQLEDEQQEVAVQEIGSRAIRKVHVLMDNSMARQKLIDELG